MNVKIGNTYPFVFCIHCHENTIFASTETGHVICLPFNEPKKPKFILEASLSCVVYCQLAKFNPDILLTLSKDESFSLFNYTKRSKGYPDFIEKYSIPAKPNWLETIGNNILVATDLP